MNYVGGGVLLRLYFSYFSKQLSVLTKSNSSFNNPGIFHNFAAGLFVGNSIQCENL